MPFSNLPYRRYESLTIHSVGKDTLVHDAACDKTYCLNAIVNAVWELCDGQRTTAQLAVYATELLQHPISEEIVVMCLSDLDRDGLLQVERYTEVTPDPSRRVLAKKIDMGAN